jgi:hypothetical protein
MTAHLPSNRGLYLHLVGTAAAQLSLVVVALALHAVDRWFAVTLLLTIVAGAAHTSMVFRPH